MSNLYGAILIGFLGGVAYEVAMDEPPPLRRLMIEGKKRLAGPALIAFLVLVAICLVIFAYMFCQGLSE